jgi:hypothetical protein
MCNEIKCINNNLMSTCNSINFMETKHHQTISRYGVSFFLIEGYALALTHTVLQLLSTACTEVRKVFKT